MSIKVIRWELHFPLEQARFCLLYQHTQDYLKVVTAYLWHHLQSGRQRLMSLVTMSKWLQSIREQL